MNEENCPKADKPLYELVQEPPLREYVQLGSAANAALAAAAGPVCPLAMRINTPTHEAMGDSTNTTLATKKKKVQRLPHLVLPPAHARQLQRPTYALPLRPHGRNAGGGR